MGLWMRRSTAPVATSFPCQPPAEQVTAWCTCCCGGGGGGDVSCCTASCGCCCCCCCCCSEGGSGSACCCCCASGGAGGAASSSAAAIGGCRLADRLRLRTPGSGLAALLPSRLGSRYGRTARRGASSDGRRGAPPAASGLVSTLRNAMSAARAEGVWGDESQANGGWRGHSTHMRVARPCLLFPCPPTCHVSHATQRAGHHSMRRLARRHREHHLPTEMRASSVGVARHQHQRRAGTAWQPHGSETGLTPQTNASFQRSSPVPPETRAPARWPCK